MRKIATLGTACVLIFCTSISSALSVAGAAFQPLSLADSGKIIRIQGYAANTSQTDFVTIAASFPSNLNDSNPIVDIRIFGNGQFFKCTLSSMNFNTGSSSSTDATTFASGQATLHLALQLVGGDYFHSVRCIMPKQIGLASSYILAAQIS